MVYVMIYYRYFSFDRSPHATLDHVTCCSGIRRPVRGVSIRSSGVMVPPSVSVSRWLSVALDMWKLGFSTHVVLALYTPSETMASSSRWMAITPKGSWRTVLVPDALASCRIRRRILVSGLGTYRLGAHLQRDWSGSPRVWLLVHLKVLVDGAFLWGSVGQGDGPPLPLLDEWSDIPTGGELAFLGHVYLLNTLPLWHREAGRGRGICLSARLLP
jgi:hypothetical protein